MEVKDIIALVVFVLPGLIGVTRRKKHGFIYAILSVVMVAILIAGFGELINLIAIKFDKWPDFNNNVLYVTKYNRLIMDEIGIPALEPIFGKNAKGFIYIATCAVYIILSVLSNMFYNKKKKTKANE